MSKIAASIAAHVPASVRFTLDELTVLAEVTQSARGGRQLRACHRKVVKARERKLATVDRLS